MQDISAGIVDRPRVGFRAPAGLDSSSSFSFSSTSSYSSSSSFWTSSKSNLVFLERGLLSDCAVWSFASFCNTELFVVESRGLKKNEDQLHTHTQSVGFFFLKEELPKARPSRQYNIGSERTADYYTEGKSSWCYRKSKIQSFLTREYNKVPRAKGEHQRENQRSESEREREKNSKGYIYKREGHKRNRSAAAARYFKRFTTIERLSGPRLNFRIFEKSPLYGSLRTMPTFASCAVGLRKIARSFPARRRQKLVEPPSLSLSLSVEHLSKGYI